MESYKTINVGNRQHVLREANPRGMYSNGEKVPDANYLGTGMALCGVLKKGETLKSFLKHRNVTCKIRFGVATQNVKQF